MNSKFILLILAGIFIALSGCNSVYFYETEKFALNVEARPEATRPVSGTAGMSMHVAAVVPSQKVGSDGNADDPEPSPAHAQVKPGPAYNYEALSLMSYFNLEKKDDIVDIETVLITGRAHKDIAKKPGMQADIFNALGGSSKSTAISITVIRHVFDDMNDRQYADEQAKTYVVMLNQLVQVMPEYYPVRVYGENLISQDPPVTELQLRSDIGGNISIDEEGFDKVLTYWGKINDSLDELDKTLGNNAITIDGFEQTPAITSRLRRDRDDTENELKRLRHLIGANPTVKAMVQYWTTLQG